MDARRDDHPARPLVQRPHSGLAGLAHDQPPPCVPRRDLQTADMAEAARESVLRLLHRLVRRCRLASAVVLAASWRAVRRLQPSACRAEREGRGRGKGVRSAHVSRRSRWRRPWGRRSQRRRPRRGWRGGAKRVRCTAHRSQLGRRPRRPRSGRRWSLRSAG